MLPGRAKRSNDSLRHLGQTRGATTESSGSKPQLRHCSWKTATREMLRANGSYVTNWPCDSKRSMLIDISSLLRIRTYAVLGVSVRREKANVVPYGPVGPQRPRQAVLSGW